MAVRAVLFDIGGVLEITPPTGVAERWEARLGLRQGELGAREREQERYQLEELTDLIVYSHEVGMSKPDPRIYELACARLGVRPEETVFLDDTEAMVDGARAVGMQALLFEHNAQAIAEIEALIGDRRGGGTPEDDR